MTQLSLRGVGRNICQRINTRFGIIRTCLGNGIVHPFSLLAANYNAGITQDLHVVRERRLGYIQFFQQFARTLLTRTEHLQHTNAVFIPKRLEHGNNVPCLQFICSPPIDIFLFHSMIQLI